MLILTKNLSFLFFFAAFLLIFSEGCKQDLEIINNSDKDSDTDYPENIAKIVLTKCAVSGCHNDISKDAAAGLSLTSWENMMQGSRGGAVVIPYNHQQSTLFLFTNTFLDIGASVIPTMPAGGTPLSKEEVISLRDWIDMGAPDKGGMIKFSDNPNRKKFYVTNQGCDIVAVFDQETGLIMRYIDVGRSSQIESPHMVKISPDKQYWYVVFTAGNVIQKYRTSDDTFVGEINIGLGNWNTFTITSDSKKAFIVDWNSNGVIAYVNLDNMSLIQKYQGSGLYIFPHGIALHPLNKILYITSQTGNYIYKIDINNPAFPEEEKIVLEPGQLPNNTSSLDPHEIVISPDGTKYYVTCQKSNEVRVFDISNDNLITVIPTGGYPQEMSFSTTTDYLFVSCTNDITTYPGHTGSVSVINYQTNTFIKSIKTGYQPHGIAVDDNKNLVYVTHRNIDSNGLPPHHTTSCGGRNGYLTVIDLNTLELAPGKKVELSVDPYFIDIRK